MPRPGPAKRAEGGGAGSRGRRARPARVVRAPGRYSRAQPDLQADIRALP